MSSIDLSRFYIDFEGSPHSIPLADHPDDYSTEMTGRIYFFDGNIDEEGKEVKAGEISMTHVNLSGAMDDNRNLLDVLDAHQHTFDFAPYILDENGSPFSTAIEDLFDHEIGNYNFLLIDDLWLLPPYRGYNLGLLALRAAIRHSGSGVGVVGMDIYPPQCYDPTTDQGYHWNRTKDWYAIAELEEFEGDEQRGIDALCRHFNRVGFERLEGTSLMFHSTSFSLPTIKELMQDCRKKDSQS